ncbi:coenzyme F420-0:L-glutamate ligase [Stackebrandtia soli]|uniref:coenzyme F420-0:L-glutamate ligase n=1 Tax=Stackebrandtia soli TaxID=1892856 RepID=UPI0039EB1676
MTLEIVPVAGIGEIAPGDDLAAIIASATSLRDGDVVAVTSKIVSKAEDRYVAGDRRAAIELDTVEVVAAKGDMRIVRTPHGLVMAAAGVDASNVPQGRVLRLPVDPDGSARALRARLGELTGADVGIVITDTMGRAWRAGQTDAAIGVAGLEPAHDLRGGVDDYGNPLSATITAVADEIAAAADLVKGKLGGVPVAILRGLSGVGGEDGPGAVALVRPPHEDLFRLGTAEAHAAGRRDAARLRRTVRTFTDAPVPREAITEAVATAVTAPAPHHTTPWRFVHVRRRRVELLTAMRDAWIEDLRRDGFGPDAIGRRIARGDVLWNAPELVVPFVTGDGAHPYPDSRRAEAEATMFAVAAGAAVQNLLVALAARGLGSCWVSSTMFCADVVTKELDLPPDWRPMGTIGIGYPASDPAVRPERVATDFLIDR